MKKSILNLGEILSKKEQKSINGSYIKPFDECKRYCYYDGVNFQYSYCCEY